MRHVLALVGSRGDVQPALAVGLELRRRGHEVDDVGGADTVVTGLLGQEVAAAVAERRGLGMAALHYCPVRANGVVSPVSGLRGPVTTRAAWARPGVLAGVLAEVLDDATAARAAALGSHLVPPDRAVAAAADAITSRA